MSKKSKYFLKHEMHRRHLKIEEEEEEKRRKCLFTYIWHICRCFFNILLKSLSHHCQKILLKLLLIYI